MLKQVLYHLQVSMLEEIIPPTSNLPAPDSNLFPLNQLGLPSKELDAMAQRNLNLMGMDIDEGQWQANCSGKFPQLTVKF